MDTDFRSIFAMEVAPLVIVLRATLVYLGLCVLMRVIPKRHAGTIAPNDVVLAVVIGGVAVAAMAKEFMSVPGVLIIIGTVLGWNYLLDWLAYRFPILRPYLREPPTCLIEDGRMLHRNLRREFVTDEELMAELRKQGVSDVSEVKAASLEADGSVSVVRKDGGSS